MNVHVARIAVTVAGMAFENSAKVFELISVIGRDFFRRIIGQILDRHDFEPEQAGGDVYIGALLFSVVGLGLLLGAGIDREPGIAHVGAFIDVNGSHGSFDVDLFFLAVRAL